MQHDDFIEAETLIEVDGVYHPESEIKAALEAKEKPSFFSPILQVIGFWAVVLAVGYAIFGDDDRSKPPNNPRITDGKGNYMELDPTRTKWIPIAR